MILTMGFAYVQVSKWLVAELAEKRSGGNGADIGQ